MANQTLKPADRIEILTLQNNYIEITAMDNTTVPVGRLSWRSKRPCRTNSS
jgi:hypothetical protein